MPHPKTFLILLAIAASALQGCSSSTNSGNTDSLAHIEYIETGDSLSLPLPSPPQTLTDPHERADFVALHFWDKMDFSSSRLVDSDDFMEQNFANFCALLPVATPAGAGKAVATLLSTAARVSPAVPLRLMDIADKYLADPNSPMRSESQYVIFLREALRLKQIPQEQTERWRYRLSRAALNSPGSPATDFNVRTSAGLATSLSALPSGSDRKIVIFYDDDCDRCKEILASLRENRQLDTQIASGATTVIAVNATASPEGFSGSGKIPSAWTDVVPVLPDGTTIDDLYDLPAMPVIYVLSPSGTVIEKDASSL